MDIVLLGIPGSGKGTQADLISQEYGLPQIGAGELMRAEAKKDTEMGREVKTLLEQRLVVTPEIVMGVIEQELGRLKNQDVILDGVPRNQEQTVLFKKMMEKLGREYKVICLEVDEQEVINRIQKRAEIEGREEDQSLEDIAKRMTWNVEGLAEVKTAYEGKVVEIDGMGSKEEVWQRIKQEVSLIK